MNTGRPGIISKSSTQVVISQNDHGGSPLLLPGKHPLEDSLLQAEKRRRLNEDNFAPELFSKRFNTQGLQQQQSHPQISRYELGSSPAALRPGQFVWPTFSAQQLPQLGISRPFSSPSEVPHRQIMTLSRGIPSSEIISQPCVATQKPSVDTITNVFNSDSSMATDHPDALENDDQEFSILNIIPTLISEKNRKAAFVENLVDAAGLIIELIWANFSVSPCAKIITLRVFLQETLKRSRTSYSTLQTALFYLFRIKGKIASLSHRNEFPLTPTSEYPPDLNQSQNNDPATCGRRMFLAALIVASKYLQDRNYSNRAWSKISGLPVNEINANEICFLKLIDYNLFISESIFKRWSSLLLTHIQAISGTRISSPDAFRRDENQREVRKFKDALKYIDPKTMECKRTNFGIYPITPAVSAPGSPREHHAESLQAPAFSIFPAFQRLKSGQCTTEKESRSKNDKSNTIIYPLDPAPALDPVFSLEAQPQPHILTTVTPSTIQQPSATQYNLDHLQVFHGQPSKGNSVFLPSSSYFKNHSYSLPRSKGFNRSKDTPPPTAPPPPTASSRRLLPEPTELNSELNVSAIQNNCGETAFEGRQNNQILLRSSA